MNAKISILIIDDNQTNIDLLEYLLKFNNYNVETALSAEQGLTKLKSFKPEMILVDISMPGMSGFDFLKKFRDDVKYDDICIIAITSFAMQGDEEIALKAGFFGYITKPINVTTLPTTLANCLQKFKKAQAQI